MTGLTVYAPLMSLTRSHALGGAVYEGHLLHAMADAGFRFVVRLIFEPEHESRAEWAVRTFPIRRGFKLGALLTNALFLLGGLVDRWVHRAKWDVVRIGDPVYSGVAGVLIARLTRVPCYCHVHHVDEGLPKRRMALTRFVVRRADLVVVISRFGARQCETTLGVPPERIAISYPGVPFPARYEGTRHEAKAVCGVAGAPLLVFAGAITRRKNLDALVRAFAIVRKSHPACRLTLIGGVPPGGMAYRNELEALARGAGLSDAIRLTGFVDEEIKARWLSAADVFVFPSRVEGFGMAPAEAMARGVPCVVSPNGSLPEIVEDGSNGLVADPHDERAFAAAIARLLDDESFRARLGERARRDVTSRFSWDRSAGEIGAALQRMIAGKGTVSRRGAR